MTLLKKRLSRLQDLPLLLFRMIPVDFLVASKPGQLPFSEMTRLLFHFFESIFYSLQASKYLPHLPIADAAEWCESPVTSAGDQSANFFPKIIPDHPLAAQIDQC